MESFAFPGKIDPSFYGKTAYYSKLSYYWMAATEGRYARPARRVCSLMNTTNQNKNAIFCVVHCMRQKNFISTKSR